MMLLSTVTMVLKTEIYCFRSANLEGKIQIVKLGHKHDNNNKVQKCTLWHLSICPLHFFWLISVSKHLVVAVIRFLHI